MPKKMCRDENEILKKKDKKEPRYTCKICGAVTVKEKHLCKPKKIK
jgi:hypothetical protein